MTPRTRTSNRDADYKVYYSKKVPQQIYFPHKSKTVRRPSTPADDGQGKRQMVFLPDKMKGRRTGVIGDSDEDSEGVDTDLEVDTDARYLLDVPQAGREDEQNVTKKTKQKGRKRNSSVTHEEQSSETDDSITHTSKRHCKNVSTKSRRGTRRVKSRPSDERDKENIADRERAMRRQSTMTQLVDGRKPLPGVEEPEFKPVKRGSRLSWGGKSRNGKNSKDGKQRTLTQMVPGMRKLEVMSDEDLEETLSDAEAEDRGSQAYGDAVAQRLAQQGLYQTDSRGEELTSAQAEEVMNSASIKKEDSMEDSQATRVVLQSVEDHGEESYRPTQFIDAPSRRLERTTQRKATVQTSKIAASHALTPKKSNKAWFSLLSTPEKRRIHEIPSSQSPADSPLSTQRSPYKSNRSPLKERSERSINAADPTSKRKQVTFKTLSKTPIPPPKLKRFESTIQDSEDEDDDFIEEGAFQIKQPTNTLRELMPSQCVGADASDVLDATDGAGADTNGTSNNARPESSQESDSSPALRGVNKPSPELGEPHVRPSDHRDRAVRKGHSARDDERIRIKQEPNSEDEGGEDLPVVSSEFPHKDGSVEGGVVIKTEAEQYGSTPPVLGADIQDTFPSTPMAIKDESSDEVDTHTKDPTPPWNGRLLPQSTSSNIQQSEDLDGESIQVPRSPSPEDESQQSHTSKAEQQLHDEWLSYSQYVHTRPTESSSVRVIPDAFSYNDTPRPPQAPPQHQPSGYRPSQATTVDEVTQRTPRKQRIHDFSSTHTTPHRIANSQPVISPSKPPPLFIPSSFPSPEKAGMEGWSSPVLGMTQATGAYRSSQWASLEDFSIPLPPPMHDDIEDED